MKVSKIRLHDSTVALAAASSSHQHRYPDYSLFLNPRRSRRGRLCSVRLHYFAVVVAVAAEVEVERAAHGHVGVGLLERH